MTRAQPLPLQHLALCTSGHLSYCTNRHDTHSDSPMLNFRCKIGVHFYQAGEGRLHVTGDGIRSCSSTQRINHYLNTAFLPHKTYGVPQLQVHRWHSDSAGNRSRQCKTPLQEQPMKRHSCFGGPLRNSAGVATCMSDHEYCSALSTAQRQQMAWSRKQEIDWQLNQCEATETL